MNGLRFPTLFIGHGSPMNAIEDNEISRGWKKIGAALPNPKAVLCISAHWETVGVRVTAMKRPATIHDFMGFPKQLQEKQYPAPGSPELVKHLTAFLSEENIHLDHSWGLDHGAWSVLCRLFPKADIPVVQFSLDRQRSPQEHFDLGKKLKILRDEGILIVGSGNIVHNLRMIGRENEAYDWAVQYDNQVKQWIIDKDYDSIIHYEKQGKPAELAVNSTEHFLPLLYILGAIDPGESINFFNEIIWGGAFSMRCLKVG